MKFYQRKQEEIYAKWIDENFDGRMPLFVTLTSQADKDGDLNDHGELHVEKINTYKPPDDVVYKKVRSIVKSLAEIDTQSVFFLEYGKKGYPHVHGIVESYGDEKWYIPQKYWINAHPHLITGEMVQGRWAEPRRKNPRLDGGTVYRYMCQEWKRTEGAQAPQRPLVTSGSIKMNGDFRYLDRMDASLVFPMETLVDIGWITAEECTRLYASARYVSKEGRFIDAYVRKEKYEFRG